ncbi:MAG: FCD domain-containing protein [Chloroflexota bacterium]
MVNPSYNGLSEFMSYLAACENGDTNGLPSLTDLSHELGISVAGLREQLEVARALGLVEVRPRTGTRRLTYSFAPAVRQSLAYAIALDRSHFIRFADMRKHIELAYWHEAVALLTEEDTTELQALMQQAWDKLNGSPVQIPHDEHRKLHLAIFRRLDNPFVTGLLEAYWDAYKAVGLDVYTDYNYLKEVWQFHQQMVDAIVAGDFEAGFTALREHTDLIYHRPG